MFLLLYPVFYAGLEMTRTYGDFAFPWSHLGYVFGNHLELLQMLSYVGIFGYTILVVASNQAVAHVISGSAGIKKKILVSSFPVAIFVLLSVQGSVALSARRQRTLSHLPEPRRRRPKPHRENPADGLWRSVPSEVDGGDSPCDQG